MSPSVKQLDGQCRHPDVLRLQRTVAISGSSTQLGRHHMLRRDSRGLRTERRSKIARHPSGPSWPQAQRRRRRPRQTGRGKGRTEKKNRKLCKLTVTHLPFVSC